MTDFRICKHCKFHVRPKEYAEDQAAIMHGFCSNVCRQLYESEKQFILERGGL